MDISQIETKPVAMERKSMLAISRSLFIPTTCLRFITFIILAFLRLLTIGYGNDYPSVQECMNANPAPSGCYNWSERTTENGVDGEKVWQRCNATASASDKAWFVNGVLYHTSGDPLYALSCNGNTHDRQYTADFYQFYEQKELLTLCNGETREYDWTQGINAVGVTSPCLIANASYDTTCRQYDTPICFVPNECQDPCCGVTGECCPYGPGN